MPTRQQVRDIITKNHNAYHDKWNSIKTPRERFRETQELRDIRDNFIESLDPELKKSFNDAKEFIKQEYPYVYWNSGWSNCTDYDDILGKYHGVSKWDHLNGDGIDMNEEFKPANVSPKQILVDAYRWCHIWLDKMRDVQAAGGLDTSHIDSHEKHILAFIEDVMTRNEDLTRAA